MKPLGRYVRELRSYARDLMVNRLGTSFAIPRHLRWMYLRACGLDLDQCAIAPGGFYGSHRIRVGHGSFLNYGVFIDGAAQVTIGRDCQIGMYTMMLTGSHRLGNHANRAGAAVAAPVTIGDGTWIGARVTVLPGVTIGPGCVIAAGAVVTSDCEADTLYGGVPAKMLRRLGND